MSKNRVIALIDMDCFYVQVEQRGITELNGKPCAVAQYLGQDNGGLIAVNYEARNFGVKRGMRGHQAKKVCPDLHVFKVAEVRGKADLTKYRDASTEVFNAIYEFSRECSLKLEKASIDEAYLDLTEEIDKRELIAPSFEVLGSTTHLQLEDISLSLWLEQINENSQFNSDEIRLAIGAGIAKQIRDKIFEKTQFRCSAGISYNKVLSKLACGINKPNAQTILPYSGVKKLFDETPISKIRYLGGKLGDEIKQQFSIETMGQLRDIDLELLKNVFGPRAHWLNNLANGYDDEIVNDRILAKTIGCGKNFPGKNALATEKDLLHWLIQLSDELIERLRRDKLVNKRSARNVTVYFRFMGKDSISRVVHLDSYCDNRQLADLIMKQVFSKIKLEPIINLMLSASKFIDDCNDLSNNNSKLENYFAKVSKSQFEKNKLSNPLPGTSSKVCKNNLDIKNYFSEIKHENKTNSSENKTNSSENEKNPSENETNLSENNLIDNNSNDSNISTNSEVDEKPFKLTVQRGFFYRKLCELKRIKFG